jgi:hypothetical protein
MFQQPRQVQRSADLAFDVSSLQLRGEFIVYQTHYVFFMLVAHTVKRLAK